MPPEFRQIGQSEQVVMIDGDEVVTHVVARATTDDGGIDVAELSLAFEQQLGALGRSPRADHQRAVLRLAHDGYADWEIGEKFGKTENAIQLVRKRAARRVLRDLGIAVGRTTGGVSTRPVGTANGTSREGTVATGEVID